MKKIALFLVMLLSMVTYSYADGEAKIVFKEIEHDFGQFPESSPKVSCVFFFTNEGDAPLVIHQAIASCGCTAPQYPKTPIKPGESGEIKVFYNGAGRYPGKFKKTIRIRTNGNPEITTLFISGEMTKDQVKEEK